MVWVCVISCVPRVVGGERAVAVCFGVEGAWVLAQSGEGGERIQPCTAALLRG